MNKHILIFLASILAVLPQFALAQDTFPKDEAGIAAYYKIDNLNLEDFNKIKTGFFDSVKTIKENHIIGQKSFKVTESNSFETVNPYIYLGADGWLVAYFAKTEPYAQIAYWDSTDLDNNILKMAISDALSKIGKTITNPIKYYDFANPTAKKLAIIREWVNPGQSSYYNEFNITVPGNIFKASYALSCIGCQTDSLSFAMLLHLDNQQIGGERHKNFIWGNYDLSLLTSNTDHAVNLTRRLGMTNDKAGGYSVIVYNPE